MFLGQSRTVRDYRPQFIDINLIPTEYRRRPFPVVTVVLGAFLFGLLILLYGLFYEKTYTDLEIEQLGLRVTQAQSVVDSAAGDPATLARQQQLRAYRDDYKSLSQRQVNWADVFQVIGDVPENVVVRTVNQAGFGVTVTGSALDQAAAATYLDRLKNSALFVDSAIQTAPGSGPLIVGSGSPVVPLTIAPPRTEPPARVQAPAPPLVPVAAPAPAPVGPQPVFPRAVPVAAPPAAPPAAPRAQPAPVSPRPVAVAVPAGKQPTPTRVVTSTITPTASVTPSPTPAYDFVLLTVKQVPANPSASNSDIKGTIIDRAGNLVTGYQVEIDSEGLPPWSAQSSPTQMNGTFSFNVSHGKFKIFVVAGSSQPAMDIYTGVDGTPGTNGYLITFQKTFDGAVPPAGPGSETATPTASVTPTETASPSPTQIVPGTNIASLGCASAYLVQNGSVASIPGNSNPNLAIDGNFSTEWNSGVVPASGTQVIWQWTLPQPGNAPTGCIAVGLSDAKNQITGFQLIPDQNPAGPTDHELWLYSDPGCTIDVKSDSSAYHIWQQSTSAGQVLPLALDTPLAVRCVIIRTITDPGPVAWEEVQIFQGLVPPQGFPSQTPTPTVAGSETATGTPAATGTETDTPTKTGTPTMTATPTATGTSTVTPTLTETPLPPVPGQNIAPFVPSVTSNRKTTKCPGPVGNGPGFPCSAIDNDASTYWAPSPGSSDPQGLSMNLASSHFLVGTDSVSDIRLIVQSSGTGGSEDYQVIVQAPPSVTPVPGQPTPTPVSCLFTSPSTGYADYTELDCPFATPLANATGVQVLQYHGGTEDGSYGIREIQIYKPTFGLPTPKTTHGPPTATKTWTPTATKTSTATASPCQSCTLTPTSTTGAPTLTSTPTGTATDTPTTTSTATVTSTATCIPGQCNPPLRSSAEPSARATPSGLGRGPGDAPEFSAIQPATVPVASPPTGISQQPAASAVVDFTIVLEVGSGTGYP